MLTSALFIATWACTSATRRTNSPDGPSQPKLSLSVIGATCDNMIREDGVLEALSKMGCGRFGAYQYETRIFGTVRSQTKADSFFPSWRAPPSAKDGGSCSLEVFQKEMDIVVVPSTNLTDLDAAITQFDGGTGVRLFYFCLPPSLVVKFATAAARDARASSTDVRFMIEKPIGNNAETAASVQQQLSEAGIEDDELYLIDHFLGEPMIHMMTESGFRGTGAAGDILSGPYFDKQVVVIQAETRDLAGRVASFFDDVGQVRDLTQSHLLQMLAVASLPPGEKVDISEEKTRILLNTVVTDDVAGQYNGYLQQLVEETNGKGLPPVNLSLLSVGTETYSKLTFEIKNERWAKVPFVIETGKNLDADNWLVRYEASSGCNFVVNVWGEPEVREKPTPLADKYWIALENVQLCSAEIQTFFSQVAAAYNGVPVTIEVSETERRMKLTLTQGGRPAYSNIFGSIVAGRRDQCIDFKQVNAQWRSLVGHLDHPPEKVLCYEKCQVRRLKRLRTPCPVLGTCTVRRSGVSVGDLIAAGI